ncbi:MAG: NADH-quinone oxidoreductase subunit NuoN [Actinomycetales bacterium]
MTTFLAPEVDWLAAAPVLFVFSAAVIGVLVEAFAPRSGRRLLQMVIALLGLAGALVALGLNAAAPASPLTGLSPSVLVATGSVAGLPMGMQMDPVSLFLQATLVVLGALSVLLLGARGGDALDPFAADAASRPESAAERAAERAGREITEVFPLMMFSIGGMMVFAAAADLLTMFVALEVLSLPLYIMCGLSRTQRLRSQEASLKYFLLGAFSSALFLFGMAMIYGAAGTLNLTLLTQQVGQVYLQAQQTGQPVQWQAFVVVAALLMLAGLLFKVGAVPFHSWTPDVYEGAPTPVTAFMAACTKVAAFGVLLRLMLPPLPTADGQLMWPGTMWFMQDALQPVLVIIAILTMVVGSAVAIKQTDVKRMLGYSSVAHAGFILCGLVSFQVLAVRGVLFYLFVYGLSSIAAFGIVSLVRVRNDNGGIGPEARNLEQWNGLGRRSPMLALCFSVLMLAFAGFPLTSGFIAKFGVFSAAVSTGSTWLIVLAVVGVIMSAVAASFYLRVIVRMYFSEPGEAGDTTISLNSLTMVAVGVGVLATIVFGLLPGPLLDVAGTMVALP